MARPVKAYLTLAAGFLWMLVTKNLTVLDGWINLQHRLYCPLHSILFWKNI